MAFPSGVASGRKSCRASEPCLRKRLREGPASPNYWKFRTYIKKPSAPGSTSHSHFTMPALSIFLCTHTSYFPDPLQSDGLQNQGFLPTTTIQAVMTK